MDEHRARVLLVEDDLETVELVRGILSPDVSIDHACTRSEVKYLLTESSYDFFILDIHLPDSDGYDVFFMIRNDPRHNSAPVVFLTADRSEQSRLTGFGIGADDYITKPIRAEEFKKRVLERLKAAKKQAAELRRYGFLVIDPVDLQAYVEINAERRSLELTPVEFKVLGILSQHLGEVVERKTLIQEVWGPSVHVTNRILDAHVASLRRKLPVEACQIDTIYGVGYQFSLHKPYVEHPAHIS